MKVTWYEATAQRGPARPALAARVAADVCVIGAGLAGLTTALELARRGTSVVLVEARRIAWAASGRNGGFVSNGFAEGIETVAARVGFEPARALYGLSCFGTEFVRREIAESEPSIKMGDGWLGAIRHDGAAKMQAGIAAKARDFGIVKTYFETAQTMSQLVTERYFQSSHDASAFHMQSTRTGCCGVARLPRACPNRRAWPNA